jgi:hypothetical protein
MVPKLLETPKGKDGVVMDRKNLAYLRRLAEERVEKKRATEQEAPEQEEPRGDGPS